jgi:lipoprotein-anchoring transpeptidase ErfK/SrfK
MAMELKDFGEFRDPRRGPWLLVVVLAILVVIFLRTGRKKSSPEPAPATPPAPSSVERVPPPPVPTGPVAARPSATPAPVPPSSPGVPPAPVVSPAADVQALSNRARQLETGGQLLDARVLLLDALSKPLSVSGRWQIEQMLGRLNVQLVTTGRAMPEKTDYVVRAGDSISKIANKFRTTTDLIQSSNGITDPNRIKAGDQLRVFNGKFGVTVSKTRNDLMLELNGRFFKRYRVGTGKFGKTPTGVFKITERIKEPVWWRPDGKEVPYGSKENILGTRWMALGATGQTPKVKGYGIHGTWEPDSIGKAESAGCIRMLNQEVEELFVMLPVGTPVTIAE